MSWKLAIVGIIVIPLLIIPTRTVGRTRWALLSKSQEKTDEMNERINETLSVSGSLLVKLFAREKKEYDRFVEVNEEVTQYALKEQRSGKWFHMVMGMFTQIAPLLIYFAGGLFIIGTERHESRRIDNQLRGRSGRQGDPGESRFYLSLQDDLMRLFSTDRVMGMMDSLGLEEDMPIDAKILSNAVENAQKNVESRHFRSRKNVLEYDNVMNTQREVIYAQRQKVLDGEDLRENMLSMLRGVVEANVSTALSSAGGINEIQYAALLMMVAKVTGYEPGVFTHFVANEQIYDRHMDNAHEMLRRAEVMQDDTQNPVLVLNKEGECQFEDFTIDDFEMKDYSPMKPQLKFELGI